MATARLTKQVVLKTANQVGMLDKVSSAIAGAGINILHLSAYEQDKDAYFFVHSADLEGAKKVLGNLGELREEEVLLVEFDNKGGQLAPVAQKLANKGININYVYGSSANGSKVNLVLKTSDNLKAQEAING